MYERYLLDRMNVNKSFFDSLLKAASDMKLKNLEEVTLERLRNDYTYKTILVGVSCGDGDYYQMMHK